MDFGQETEALVPAFLVMIHSLLL